MGIRTLVVEDDSRTCDLLELMLRRAHMEVEVAESGSAALKYLENHHPDVAVIDLHMKHVNGYDVINAIRADERLQNMVIIVITANPSAINSPEAQKANAFLAKPIDIQRIVEVIQKLVQVRQ